MFSLLRRLFHRESALITTRSTGRPRTYSADSGYVYEYSFSGFRRTSRRGETYLEYVFIVTGARVPRQAVAILLPEGRLRDWVGLDRDLSASERYAIAKLGLKQALDGFPDPKSLETEVFPDQTQVSDIGAVLDL